MNTNDLKLLVLLFLLTCTGLLSASPLTSQDSLGLPDTMDSRTLPFEGFEAGNFSAYDWVNDSVQPWTVQSSQVYEGNYAAQNGNIGLANHSTLMITIYASEPGNISFYHKVSSDPVWAFLRFNIDGVQYLQVSGIQDWQVFSQALSPGIHTLSWTFNTVPFASGEDRAWLDNISFPPSEIYFAPPQNLRAESANLAINLAWDPPEMDNPQSYNVYRNGEYLSSCSTLNYLDNTVQNDIPYSYEVTALYQGGESGPSNTVSATASAFSLIALGDGTNSTGSTIPNPMDVSYKSLHDQSIFTAAELEAAGIRGPAKITSLGFYVTNISGMNMVNYVIRMKHTEVTNLSSWIGPEDLTTVFSHSGFRPTVLGWNMISLSTPFLWNGVDNIVVDTAFGINLFPSNSGDVRYSIFENGYRCIQSNDIDLRNTFSGGTVFPFRPNLRLCLEPVSEEAFITANPASFSFPEIAVNETSAAIFTLYNSGNDFLMGSITAPAGFFVLAQNRDAESESLARNVIGINIPPLHSQNYILYFSPQSSGDHSSSLQIESNAGNAPLLNLAISASAYQPPTIAVSDMPSCIRLETNSGTTHSFYICNTGDRELSYNISLSQNSSPINWLQVNPTAGTVEAGQQSPIELSFSTDDMELGMYQIQLDISSNDPWNSGLDYTIYMEVLGELLPPVISINRVGDHTRLSWETVPGSDEYLVLRSFLPDTGFEIIGATYLGEYWDQAPQDKVFYRVVAVRY